MARVVAAGVAVIDFVMHLDEMPSRAEKYRARDAAVVGGGCAATAMVAAARLGGEAALAVRLGDDQIGDMIVLGLEREGVDCGLVRRFEGRRSSFSSVFVSAAGERQIVNFRDTDLSFDAGWLEDATLPAFDAALGDTRWPQGAAALLRVAHERGLPGVLDAEAPVMEALDALAAASHVAFSAQGLRDFTGVSDLLDGLRIASGRIDAWVFVTDGGNGVYWIDGGELIHEPGFEVDVVDTLGAGDVWHGAFALGLGEGMQVRTAIRFASAAAALKCTRFGGRDGAPRRDEVNAFLTARSG